MKVLKILFVTGLALALVVAVMPASARAQHWHPLFWPFLAAGAIVGTAAALAAAPFTYPYYYGPGYYAPAPAYYGPGPAYYGPGPHSARTVWVRGHYNRAGEWVPGHRRNLVWVPGHNDRDGNWVAGHWG